MPKGGIIQVRASCFGYKNTETGLINSFEYVNNSNIAFAPTINMISGNNRNYSSGDTVSYSSNNDKLPDSSVDTTGTLPKGTILSNLSKDTAVAMSENGVLKVSIYSQKAIDNIKNSTSGINAFVVTRPFVSCDMLRLCR